MVVEELSGDGAGGEREGAARGEDEKKGAGMAPHVGRRMRRGAGRCCSRKERVGEEVGRRRGSGGRGGEEGARGE